MPVLMNVRVTLFNVFQHTLVDIRKRQEAGVSNEANSTISS